MKNGSTYLVSEPTGTNWWGQGIIPNEGCYPMEQNRGIAPSTEKIRGEQASLAAYYRERELSVVEIPFSPYLEALYRHDGIYVTDGAVTTISKNGEPISFMSHFSAVFREPEGHSLSHMLRLLGMKVHTIPANARMEGGDVLYTPYDHHYFGGLYRANEQGHNAIVARSRVEGDPVFIDSDAFHLDTVLTPVIDTRGRLMSVLAARQVMKPHSWNALWRHCQEYNIDLVELDTKDSIGTEAADYRDGSYASNCMALPGSLVGNSQFQTPGVMDFLKSRGIEHTAIPMPESAKSGGAAHCLTHQLTGVDAASRCDIPRVLNLFMHGEVQRLKELLSENLSVRREYPYIEQQVKRMNFDDLGRHKISKEDIAELKFLRDRAFQPAIHVV